MIYISGIDVIQKKIAVTSNAIRSALPSTYSYMLFIFFSSNIVSFKNAGELLEFSSVYQAHQLKAACQQFISLNLAAMLEGRWELHLQQV